MSDLSEFFLGSGPAVVQLDLLEISHPDFTQTYRLTRNSIADIDITHEGPDGPFTYSYCPMRISPVGTGAGLNQSLKVTMGDLGEIVRAEIAAVAAANTMNTKPTLTFRTYASTELTAPIFGPLIMELTQVTCTPEGVTFEAHAVRLNVSANGETYTVEKFPMMIGLI